MWTKVSWNAGVYKDDSPLEAEGFFIDANRMRFVRGLPQTFGGHEKFSTNQFTGICRGLYGWADFDGTKYLAVGTHLRLYAYDLDGDRYDITPVIERGQLTNPFDTVDGDETVTVNDTAHGLAVNQKVKFSNASAVGGITPDGEYVIATVPDANSFTIEHSSAATSTVSGGGGTVDYEYFLAPGQIDGIAALGYGTGPYGSGGYGSPTSGYTLYPRTWTFAQWGQNIVGNPRGGGLYEWAPNVTAVELVTQGDFSGATAWTVGTSWSIGSGIASATATATTNLFQAITLGQNCFNLLEFDATISAGTLVVSQGTATIETVTSTQAVKSVFYSNAGGSVNLTFLNPGTLSGSIDNVSVKVLTTGHLIPNAPTQTFGTFVTEEGIQVCLGASDSNSNFDPLLVKWSDTWGGGGVNDFSANQTWTSTNANAAGDKRLSKGSYIVGGAAASGFNLIWTNTTLYVMRFVPDPSVVYRFDEVADSAGLIGPHAFTIQDGVAKWMAPDGAWYVFAGGQVSQMDNTCRRDVFDNLANVQGDKVYASPISAYGNDIWLYPDSRDGNETSRYVVRCPPDSRQPMCWAPGVFDRTAWIDSGVFQYPIAADSSGNLWYQEKGDSEDGSPIEASLEGAYAGINGAQITINGHRPDHEDLKGGYTTTYTGQTRNTRGIFDRVVGPKSVNSTTGQINLRLTAEKVKIKWTFDDAPSFWRMGQDELDIIRTNRSR